MLKYLIVIIVLIIIFMILYVYNNINYLKELLENIASSKLKMQDLLNKKKDLLEKLLNDINNKELKVMLKKIEDDFFIKEEALYNIRLNLEKLINEKEVVLTLDEKNIYNDLKITDEELDGLKDYYNSKVSLYNEKYMNKVLCNIYKLLKLEKQKKFKLRKIESFEILKN